MWIMIVLSLKIKTGPFLTNSCKIHLFIWNDCWSKLLCLMFYGFFILKLQLRPTAYGWSLSGPNIWLRPKVKIAPTVEHCFRAYLVTVLKALLETNDSCLPTSEHHMFQFVMHLVNKQWAESLSKDQWVLVKLPPQPVVMQSQYISKQ